MRSGEIICLVINFNDLKYLMKFGTKARSSTTAFEYLTNYKKTVSSAFIIKLQINKTLFNNQAQAIV